MIQGVKVKDLCLYSDERGILLEILRKDDEMFDSFGQVYICSAFPGFVKGWHLHKIQHDNFTCIKGTMKLVLCDLREDSGTKGEINEFIVNLENSKVVQIPPGVYHGFEAIGDEEAIALNVPNKAYNRLEPDEYRLPFDTELINYSWNGKKGG